MHNITVDDIMSRDVVYVHPQTSLLEAAQLMEQKSIDGLPVLDKEGALVGIITQYDMIRNTSHIHLPTLQKVFEGLRIKDSKELQEERNKITALTVQDIMNHEPLKLLQGVSVSETVQTFRDHHRVNPIPVVDGQNKVVGVVSRYDIVKLLRFAGEK